MAFSCKDVSMIAWPALLNSTLPLPQGDNAICRWPSHGPDAYARRRQFESGSMRIQTGEASQQPQRKWDHLAGSIWHCTSLNREVLPALLCINRRENASLPLSTYCSCHLQRPSTFIHCDVQSSAQHELLRGPHPRQNCRFTSSLATTCTCRSTGLYCFETSVLGAVCTYRRAYRHPEAAAGAWGKHAAMGV